MYPDGMSEAGFHLAQVNIALLREPLHSALLADFVAALAPINALADSSPGFVWRLQTEDGDATSVRAFDDERLIVNLSTWESLESLADFVYRSVHTEVMRRRRTWFDRLHEAYTVLWWVPIGHRPSVEEAKQRLNNLQTYGPTADAFSFKTPFSPANSATPLLARDGDACPV
ncbi:MAG: DUF3291 domain-containing protein [Dehalococcoidia bacterium]